jgi:hypothetical protein
MNPMMAFYKQTWWLWLLFVVLFALLAKYVSFLFVLMIPGIILYSVYFGIVRTSELAQQQDDRDG